MALAWQERVVAAEMALEGVGEAEFDGCSAAAVGLGAVFDGFGSCGGRA